MWCRQGPLADYCEHDNESFLFSKTRAVFGLFDDHSRKTAIREISISYSAM
jgi:hypothetical protein